jgi:hypothetical protein
MRMLKLSLLVAPLVLAGCILTTGQITVDFDLGDTTVTAANVEAKDVDLNTVPDYADHKDNLEGVADIAVLGSVTNSGASDLGVMVYMTADQTNYTTDAQVKANAVPLWGPFTVAAGQTVTIGWDDSAALFTPGGKALLLDEVKGDGIFTLYFVGQAGTYSFTVNDGVLVLTLDAGL